MNFRRTVAMARKEGLHIVRDPRSLAAAIINPLSMLLIFGYALSLDVDHIPTMVYDLDRSSQSQDLIRQFRGSRFFDIVGETDNYRPIEREFNARRVIIGLVIPEDYSRNLGMGKAAQVQLLLDGSDSNTATTALAYAEGLVSAYGARIRNEAQSQRAGAVIHGGVDARIRVWYNPDLLSRNFIVPGLIAVILMIIVANLSSLTVAREWENGTMEQLLSTPVRPAEIVLGKLSAYFVLGIVDMLICLMVGVFIFDVPFKGNIFTLMISSFVFLFGALACGILISAANRTQLLAYQVGTLTSFLPAFILSGFIYSISNMPGIIQAMALFVPARYFINILNGLFLKGVPFSLIWFDFVLLVIYGAMMFFFAARKLRQKVA
ncbi:MAG TPA: ABC transporter permease [Bryobacteraceae bacterium]|nr:ABC transporter permease [Bryobacteraceae bacterium]